MSKKKGQCFKFIMLDSGDPGAHRIAHRAPFLCHMSLSTVPNPHVSLCWPSKSNSTLNCELEAQAHAGGSQQRELSGPQLCLRLPPVEISLVKQAHIIPWARIYSILHNPKTSPTAASSPCQPHPVTWACSLIHVDQSLLLCLPNLEHDNHTLWCTESARFPI